MRKIILSLFVILLINSHSFAQKTGAKSKKKSVNKIKTAVPKKQNVTQFFNLLESLIPDKNAAAVWPTKDSVGVDIKWESRKPKLNIAQEYEVTGEAYIDLNGLVLKENNKTSKWLVLLAGSNNEKFERIMLSAPHSSSQNITTALSSLLGEENYTYSQVNENESGHYELTIKGKEKVWVVLTDYPLGGTQTGNMGNEFGIFIYLNKKGYDAVYD